MLRPHPSPPWPDGISLVQGAIKQLDFCIAASHGVTHADKQRRYVVKRLLYKWCMVKVFRDGTYDGER